jgi:hypothetical protein
MFIVHLLWLQKLGSILIFELLWLKGGTYPLDERAVESVVLAYNLQV